MQFEEKAILLSAESNPYDFNGNQGTSHRVRVNVGGEIYVCKSTPEQVLELKHLVKQEGVAVLKFTSVKESLSLQLVSFEV